MKFCDKCGNNLSYEPHESYNKLPLDWIDINIKSAAIEITQSLLFKDKNNGHLNHFVGLLSKEKRVYIFHELPLNWNWKDNELIAWKPLSDLEKKFGYK